MPDNNDNRKDEKAIPLQNDRSQVWAFFEKHRQQPHHFELDHEQ